MAAIRLQKILAEAGIASRRAAEGFIREGRVAVNGAKVTELGVRADPATDTITVDGQPVRPRRKLYVALNKPRGFLCTRQDTEGRRIAHDLLPPEWKNLVPVGRLDRDSEGLLLLTNDGDFCLRLTHPRYGIRKRYVAVVEGKLDESLLKPLTEGIRDAGELLKAERVRLLSANQSHSRVELDLSEGRNREVRRLLGSLGFPVVELRRTQIGPLRLGELPPGRWRVLSPAEVKSLLPAPR